MLQRICLFMESFQPPDTKLKPDDPSLSPTTWVAQLLLQVGPSLLDSTEWVVSPLSLLLGLVFSEMCSFKPIPLAGLS